MTAALAGMLRCFLLTNGDLMEQADEQAEIAKRVKIENVLKQYELQEEEASEDKEINIYVDVEMLLEEGAVMLGELDENDSPLAGAFAFSSEGGAFELLDKMDGLELKVNLLLIIAASCTALTPLLNPQEFFELALDEVLNSVEVALQDLSSEAAQGVRTTARQMKAVTDFSTYSFQRLDAAMQATVRRRFANHRLVELQQTFERLVVARTAQDRQLAFEMCIFLFQLAQEEASSKAAAASEATTEAVDEVVDEAVDEAAQQQTDDAS